MEDIKLHRVLDPQCTQGYRVSKLMVRQDMLDSRTRDLSLNKSRAAKHANV